MKNKLQTLILLLVSFIASLTFWVVFYFADLLVIESTVIEYLYFVIKPISLLLIIFVWIYSLKKRESSNTYILIQTTIGFQIIPLIVRLLGIGNNNANFKDVLAIFIVVFSVLAYISLAIIIDRSNTKISKVMPTFKPKEIEVVEEETYYDESGKFKGANK